MDQDETNQTLILYSLSTPGHPIFFYLVKFERNKEFPLFDIQTALSNLLSCTVVEHDTVSLSTWHGNRKTCHNNTAMHVLLVEE